MILAVLEALVINTEWHLLSVYVVISICYSGRLKTEKIFLVSYTRKIYPQIVKTLPKFVCEIVFEYLSTK